LDRYSYVRNNPSKYVDPDGHFPWLIIVALAISTVVINRDITVFPPANNYPLNVPESPTCSSSLPDCFGDTVSLKDFSENGEENPIPVDEFNALTDEVADDLYSHDLTWPGYTSGRHTYDTPFYNGGSSERRTNDPNAEQGLYPSDQQVCIETLRCSDRTEINYFAQGMWGAAVGEPEIVSYGIAAAWKLWEYGSWPSDDTFYWLDYGYDYYNWWEENQDQ
jgi:hypothetical protein